MAAITTAAILVAVIVIDYNSNKNEANGCSDAKISATFIGTIKITSSLVADKNAELSPGTLAHKSPTITTSIVNAVASMVVD